MVGQSDLVDIDEVRARDLIVRCFFEAQKEIFAKTKAKAGGKIDELSLQRDVASTVKMAFREIGGDFDRPTSASLMKVVERLAIKAASWGTPEDIIGHHKVQIQSVSEALKR